MKPSKLPPYRRPADYLPPYNYCDRWCDRCVIDKTKCEVYQQEMNDRLHHVADGKDPDDPEIVIADVRKNFDASLALLREKAKELGVDLDKVEDDAPLPPPPPRPPEDPIVGRAKEITAAIAEFLRLGREHLALHYRPHHEVLAWYHHQISVKLRRAIHAGGNGEEERADAILQAQIAHKGLACMLESLTALGAARPAWRDGSLTALALMQKLMREIEERWLKKPSPLLVPVKGDEWWGPLRTAASLRKKKT